MDIDCRNNLRQIGLTTRIYADDNNERYPIFRTQFADTETDEDDLNNAHVRQFLAPLLGEQSILRCRRDGSRLFERHGSSYSWNRRMNGRLVDTNPTGSENPSRTLYFDAEPWHRGMKQAASSV